MIISVDTGNKHMKTENCEFNSGVEILDTLPGELEEVIEYEGKYYMTTNRRISYMEDKTADDRYYILTLFAIAKELSYREKNEGLLPQNLHHPWGINKAGHYIDCNSNIRHQCPQLNLVRQRHGSIF